MNPTPPLLCGTLLAAMLAAGVSHFWSVENFIAHYPISPAIRLVPVDAPFKSGRQSEKFATVNPLAQVKDSGNKSPDPESGAGKEFFENLVQELRNLRNENRALTDQIAETNRDIMKMQFQIDTHSESFRPLPTSEQRDDRSWIPDDDTPSVLPPKASPVYPIDE